MRSREVRSLPIVAVALLLAACGSGEDDTPAAAAKTVEVRMTDNEFTPSALEVEAGQTVTFRFTNEGSVAHEALVGDEDAQAKHEADMAEMAEHDMDEMDHGDSGAITVEPDGVGELTTTFDEAGTLILGCHVPGHYEAGMKATITVT